MRLSVRVSLFAAVALNFLPFAGHTWSQSQTAVLSGVVMDPRGAVIAGAQISAEPVSPSSGPKQTVSESDGKFVLPLAPGRYRLTVAHDSFAQSDQEISLAAGERRDVQVHLSLEPLSSKVVVTAQASPVEINSSPAPVTILTREEIDQRMATSLPDLLVTQPGFSLGRTGPEGGSTSLFLDGGNSNYTKVLVDGAPVNAPGGLIDFSNFTLDNVEKVEIVHGAESALYGSDAMDGVIQIFTRRGTTRIPEFSVFAEGGNFSMGRGGAELSGLIGRFDYSAGASDLETAGQGPNDSFRNRTLSGNFGRQFSDSDRVSLAVRDDDSDAGTPGQTLLKPASIYQRNALHIFSAGASWKFATGKHWRHEISGGELYSRQHSFNPLQSFYATDPAAFCPQANPSATATAELCDFTFDDLYQYNRAYINAQSTYLVRGFALTGGYNYEVENGFVSYVGTHGRRNNQGGYADIRWQPAARLTLNGGGRVEDNAYFGIRGVPRAGASYAIHVAQGAFGDTRLQASYGEGIVEPRFDQSFGTNPCVSGNPNLAPEQSRTIHAGVQQKLASDRVRLAADYFDSRFHNIISFFVTDPVNFCGTYLNTNLARARGLNLSEEARLTRWLSATGYYTYDSTRTLSAPTDPANLDPNYLPGSPLLRRPLNSGSATLNASFHKLDWNVSGYFTGKRADYNYPGQIEDPGYALFNFAAAYNIARGVSIYGRINNIADKKYSEAYGFPALGREFRIGLKYTTRRE